MASTDVAIGIDIVRDGLHALYLQRTGQSSDVAGYAASQNVDQSQLGAHVVRVIRALDAPADTPVGIAWSETTKADRRDDVVAALRRAGFAVTSEDQAVAVARALPQSTATASLVDCEIPAGLLQAHPGLTVRDLAGAAGVALGMLGLGASGVADDGDGSAIGSAATSAIAAGAGVAGAVTSGSKASRQANGAKSPAAPLPTGTAAISDAPVAPASSGFRPWMLVGLLALLIGAGVAISVLSSGDTDQGADAVPTAVPVTSAVTDPTAAPEATAMPEPAPTATAEPAATPEPAPTATAEPTPTPKPDPTATAEPEPSYPPLASLGERAAIFRPPTLFLQGPVPDQATIDALYGRAVEVLGAENIVNEYVVHPDAPPIEGDESGIRVEAAVLFQSGSAAIAPDFLPVLELAVTLFSLNPQMTAVVQGHTDSVGSAALNQQLSKVRADAVVEYLVSRGVEPSRLSAIGFGLTRPVADNDTEQGRLLNRRIEFDLDGLLDPRPS